MKKFYSLIFALMGLCMFVPAKAETYKSVVFHKTDGTTLALTVESGLTTVVGSGEIAMSCDLGIITLPTTEVTKWTFSTEPGMDFGLAGINTPEADANAAVEVTVGSGYVSLAGLQDGSSVMLTSIDGRVVAAKTAAGDVTIPTDQLTAGVYILTFNDKSLKIALK